jgi:diguanylate cyclase (GGDEF)-like protein
MGTLCASVLIVVGVTGHVPFADLYIWVVLFAALYFRPVGALAHAAAAGAAYTLVLAFGPVTVAPIQAWCGVFGTAGVAGAIVLGLVSVLRSAAGDDSLTGCANRRSWDERLEEELERSRRTGQPLSVAMIDLDAFKAVNDRGGHRAGDLLLQDVAQRWQETIRHGGDFLARLGGDEFGILAPGSDEAGIRRLARRLAEALPEGASASIGVSTWDGMENAGALLRRADQAMYMTKQRRGHEGSHSA